MYNTQGFFGANPPLFLEFPVIPEECDDSWHEMLQSHSKSKGMEDFWYIKKHAHICQTGIQRVKKQYVNYFFWIFPIQQHAKRGVCTSWKVVLILFWKFLDCFYKYILSEKIKYVVILVIIRNIYRYLCYLILLPCF